MIRRYPFSEDFISQTTVKLFATYLSVKLEVQKCQVESSVSKPLYKVVAPTYTLKGFSWSPKVIDMWDKLFCF